MIDESLIINDLKVSTKDGKEILRGIKLTIKKGEVHAIMGPNGGGKSTLAMVLMGHPAYEVTSGTIILDGTDITHLPPDKRAKLGLFLGYQYPVEIAGVNFASFLRMSVNELNKAGGKKISPIAFQNLLGEHSRELGFSEKLSKRSLNQDFSGGEKKKAEILQLAIIRPPYAVLDEPDSGLDVDALRHIASSINRLNYPIGLLIITHYQRILAFVKPDFVHVMKDGKIIKSGSSELALAIEESGYETMAENDG